MPAPGGGCSVPLEILHGALVLFRRREALERAKIPALAGRRIFLSGIKPVTTGFEFADHSDVPLRPHGPGILSPVRRRSRWAASPSRLGLETGLSAGPTFAARRSARSSEHHAILKHDLLLIGVDRSA